MNDWITDLSGFFDGYNYTKGPVHVRVEDEKITEITDLKPEKTGIDGRGMILSPPFVDGHTHLIFAGNRFNELEYKLQGLSYAEILERGGGIIQTVTQTRAASDDSLTTLVENRLTLMMMHGTLHSEVKSGYGLNFDHELRLLHILNEINHDVTVTPTFGGAHVFPEEKSREKYLEEIIEEMLPEIAKHRLATSTDVFCDRGAFSINETLSIFDQSTKLNIPVRVHAEELEYRGIGGIAAQNYDLLSADHLLHATTEDFVNLAKSRTVAMFMPTAPLGLFSDQLPSGFLHTDVTIGLGSDFNPNNWSISMQTAIRHAVFRYKIPPLLALQAATSGSYLGITGSKFLKLDVGSFATFILLRGNSLAEIASKFGQTLVDRVIKNGKIIFKNPFSTL